MFELERKAMASLANRHWKPDYIAIRNVPTCNRRLLAISRKARRWWCWQPRSSAIPV